MKRIMAMALSAFALPLVAADVYVSAERGNDATGNGSYEQPYKTIQKGVDEANAGDTVKILRGTYDTGEYYDGTHTNRVVIGKSITLEGVEGKDVTHIAGRFDPNIANGNGPAAIRCIAITNTAAANTVIKNLTLCNGAADNVNALRGYGGGIRGASDARSTVCLVDCVISNCVAVMGGGLNGVTAVRCEFTDCRTTGFGIAARYGSLLNCLIHKNRCLGGNGARPALADYTYAINCTVALGYTGNSQGIGRSAYAYNCVFFGNGAGDIVTTINKQNIAETNHCYGTATDAHLLFSPATDDYRLTAGTKAVGGGSTTFLTASWLAGKNISLPAGVDSNIDFAGNEIDTSKATCDAGCIQGSAQPAGGRILFATAGWIVNGAKNEQASNYAYYTPETWPVTVMARHSGATAEKPFSHGFLDDWRQKSGAYRWPTMDGVLPLVPPPTVGEQMKVTPKFADAVVWVDDDGDDATADGTEAHPFPVLQDAITFATNTYASSQNILVLVKPGTYDRGETLFSGGPLTTGSSDGTFCKTRLVIPAWSGFVVRSTDGAAVTTIKGAADNTGPYPNNYVGCGPNSVRCVAFYGTDTRQALQGFTLADGHSACGQYDKDIMSDRGGAAFGGNNGDYNALVDCVITNCTSVRATLYGVWGIRCKLYDCKGYGGVMRYVILSGCYVDSSCQIGTGGPGASANRVLGNDTSTYICTVPDASLWPSCRYYNTLFGKVSAGSSDALYGSVTTNALTSAMAAMGIVQVVEPGWVDPANGDWRLYAPTPVRYAAKMPSPGTADYGLWATNVAAYVTTGLSGEAISVTDGVPLAGCHQQTVGDAQSVFVAAEKGGLSVVGTSASGYSALADDGAFTVSRASATRPCIGYTVNGVTNLFDETPSRTFTAADAAAEAYGLSVQAIYTSDWYVSPTGSDSDYGYTPATPFGTLAYAMTKAVSGDTVHAAEGVYDEGSAIYSTTAGIEHPSRVIVGEHVTLLADGAAENTIIRGASDTSATANSYGMGTNAMRCVTLRDYATVKGFTLTGGRTRYADMDITGTTMEWTSFGNWTGGGVQGSSSGRDRGAFVVDCIISNCIAVYGGGASMVGLVRCKVLNCRAVNNGGGGNLVNMYGSLIDNCYSAGGGANLSSFTRIYNSTIGPHGYNHNGTSRATIATASSGVSCLINCLLLGSLGSSGGAMTNPASYTVFADTRNNYPTNETSLVIPSADLAVDADLRPIPFRNAAVDAGSAALLTDFSATDTAKRFLPYASDFDLSGKPRLTNGSLDAGALEANWLPQYAKTLGGANPKLVVDSASSNVVDRGTGSVAIPGGESLSLTWGDASLRGAREGEISVTGEGTLTMTIGGEPYATITAADGVRKFRFNPGTLSAFDFGFAFEGTGEASLSAFNLIRGMAFSFR